MRKRTPRRNPELKAPPPTAIKTSHMVYDESKRALNFVTDLLADKMDTIRRKVEVHASMGHTESANGLIEAWSLLKDAYDRSLGEILVLTRDGKGSFVDWAGVRQTQRAMDSADTAMRLSSQSMLDGIRRERNEVLSESRRLRAEVLACSNRIEALQADYSLRTADKIRELAALTKEMSILTAHAEGMKKTLDQNKMRTASLQAETLALQKALESKIRDQTAQITSLQSQINAAQSAHEIGQSAQKDAIARLNQKIAEREATISSLTKAKNACAEQIVALRKDHARQITEISAQRQSQEIAAQQLNNRISELQGSGSSDQATIESLKMSLSDAQSEITELQIAKTECEDQISQMQEPLELDIQANTTSPSNDIILLDAPTREKMLQDIADRNAVIEQMVNEREGKAADLENARKDAVSAKDDAKNMRYAAYGLGAIALIATGFAVYKSRTLK